MEEPRSLSRLFAVDPPESESALRRFLTNSPSLVLGFRRSHSSSVQPSLSLTLTLNPLYTGTCYFPSYVLLYAVREEHQHETPVSIKPEEFRRC